MLFQTGAMSVFTEIWKAILSFDRLADVLDIVLVAFLIYSVIKLLRETRAVQLAKGFVLLLIVYIFVSLLDMRLTSYLFSLLFTNLLLILVVIFAPEIRHAIESVGKSSVSNLNWFGFKNSDELRRYEEVQTSINAVCRACADMSDKNIGALMVFEKDILLGEIVATGTVVDAAISPEIIGNIFFPKAPLHDGAAIIRDNRIAAAGCILPLTKNNDISSALGTRHRAAIGMSEQSDAVVVVISEEVGAISVAHKGVLKRDISDGDLREILTEHFLKPVNVDEGKIVKWVRRHRK